MTVLVLIEHDRGVVAAGSLEALTGARIVAAALGVGLTAVVCGPCDDASAVGTQYGAHRTIVAIHEVLSDYSPEAWAATVTHIVRTESPVAVVACGTDRGNEVLAHVAAHLDVAMVANALPLANPSISADSSNPWAFTRVQWGGSLLENVTLCASTKILTFAHHSIDASPAPVTGSVESIDVDLPAHVSRTLVRNRVERTAGVTLQTARVVVSGGRGVGSPEGFAPLEALATALGGVVGCSRAVTNNGWRNHTDQVGQTGNRIAPDIYIPCGISGAIQHWVGAMASKKILAINTDKDANMVTRADYAVIGDLHTVVPAITAEIERRRAAQ
jgi:electron transfer flavoprotein alpha subunit